MFVRAGPARLSHYRTQARAAGRERPTPAEQPARCTQRKHRSPTYSYDRDVDENTARSMLELSSPRLLTTGRVEVAYAAARKHASQAPTTRSEGSAHQAHVLRLDEARAVLLNRAVRLPPNGDALVTLTVIQFFLGGAVLFATALAIAVAATTDYDSALSLVGWPIAPSS